MTVSGSVAAMLPPEEAARTFLLARVPSARDGVLQVRLRGGELLLATGDKNVRYQVAALEVDLIQWLCRRFPDVRSLRWISA